MIGLKLSSFDYQAALNHAHLNNLIGDILLGYVQAKPDHIQLVSRAGIYGSEYLC